MNDPVTFVVQLCDLICRVYQSVNDVSGCCWHFSKPKKHRGSLWKPSEPTPTKKLKAYINPTPHAYFEHTSDTNAAKINQSLSVISV